MCYTDYDIHFVFWGQDQVEIFVWKWKTTAEKDVYNVYVY